MIFSNRLETYFVSVMKSVHFYVMNYNVMLCCFFYFLNNKQLIRINE